jgi:prepilin-type processing-associated H-X9-DG protein
MHTVVLSRSDMKQVTLRMITDGLSNTILLGEYQTTTTESRRTMWAYAYSSYAQSSFLKEAAMLTPSFEECKSRVANPNDPEPCKRGWGSLHSGGVIQYGFCDGSVATIPDDIDLDVLFAAASIAGGETSSVHSGK